MTDVHPGRAPLPADEEVRLLAVEAVGGAAARSAALDELAALGARLGGTAMAFVNLVDEHVQTSAGCYGHELGELPREDAVCPWVVASADTLVVPDVAADPRFADNAALAGLGVRFYAGVPVRVFDGSVVGALCLLDTAPRAMTPEQAETALAALARQAGVVLEAQAAEVVAAALTRDADQD